MQDPEEVLKIYSLDLMDLVHTRTSRESDDLNALGTGNRISLAA